ncbi:hypothetical protein B0A48_06092 [Cryoendolithus antarcticus]|uniref:Uncharacterized protein n=1 Tax=Cryoendolithus antarcticus TaxID=1507870 RepID=A0A1V8TD77_9PEZI|nr:hypothetical protein B0A48_06092 [Cryoendolithus antarcticus]
MEFKTIYVALITALTSLYTPRSVGPGTDDDFDELEDFDDGPWIPRPPPTFRSQFNMRGCRLQCYPSYGGLWTKDADIVDMQYLNLPHAFDTERSMNATEEDAFCERLRRVGATWWRSQNDRFGHAWLDDWKPTKAQAEVLTFGWPSEGEGVWMLRYASDDEVPMGFGRIRMATSMQGKIEAMQGLGAEFVANGTALDELADDYPPEAHVKIPDYCRRRLDEL